MSRVSGDNFLLMFDAVINHISVSSDWFQRFLKGDPRYRDYFIVVPEDTDLSRVVRPRTLPLLTTFQVNGQSRKIWTTFSADQVDLNYHNPAVLLDVLQVPFILCGARRRVDPPGCDCLPVENLSGQACLHLPQTHRVIQLIRAVLDQVAPQVILITETNVPHADNLSYFGDGANEAQMVYNFALPPLVMHSLHTGNAEILSRLGGRSAIAFKTHDLFQFSGFARWGRSQPGARHPQPAADRCAGKSHPGARRVWCRYKSNPDGTTSPYELNINYFDALNDPHGSEPVEIQVSRFLASQAIMLSVHRRAGDLLPQPVGVARLARGCRANRA